MKPPPTTDRQTLLTTKKFRVVEVDRQRDDQKTYSREVIRHPGAVTILPLLEGDQICLIRNFRVAVGQELIELPAGTREPNEPPIVTAGRELIEETGFRAGKIRQIHSFFLSPGILDESMYLFAASELTAGEPRREGTEEIENLIVPWNDAMRMVREGKIRDAKTIVGLLYYEMLRTRDDGSC